MPDARRSRAPLSDNHRRGVATSLGLLDELLCRVEEWVEGREHKGALYQERNNLSASQRDELAGKVARLRRRLRSARRDMGLAMITRDAVSDIWSRCASFRESVMELDGEKLLRYGELSPEAQTYMDRLSRSLLKGLDGLVQALSRDEGSG